MSCASRRGRVEARFVLRLGRKAAADPSLGQQKIGAPRVAFDPVSRAGHVAMFGRIHSAPGRAEGDQAASPAVVSVSLAATLRSKRSITPAGPSPEVVFRRRERDLADLHIRPWSFRPVTDCACMGLQFLTFVRGIYA